MGRTLTLLLPVDPQIEALLLLQEKDLNCLKAKEGLKAIPRQIERLQASISKEKEIEAEEKTALQQLEVKRKECDVELKECEERILKYKTQQLEVKKNEEYDALNKEISHQEERISALETEELELLMKIDEEAQRFEESQEEHAKQISFYEQDITKLNERETGFKQSIDTLIAEAEEARKAVECSLVAKYDSAKTSSKGPYVVPLEDHKCKGCHLRVSNDVEVSAKHNEVGVRCSNCGRLVYVKN